MSADLLPLAKDTPLIFVAGVAADDIGIQSGGWTIEWQGATGDITPGTTILEGIQAAVSPETAVTYDPEGRFVTDVPLQGRCRDRGSGRAALRRMRGRFRDAGFARRRFEDAGDHAPALR